jgi:hypothetical protein
MNPVLQELYPSVEKQLADRESRHKRHRAMLEEHHERKHDRRERHHRGVHRMKFPAHCLK